VNTSLVIWCELHWLFGVNFIGYLVWILHWL